jgi:hypothetical protein
MRKLHEARARRGLGAMNEGGEGGAASAQAAPFFVPPGVPGRLRAPAGLRQATPP